jgi:hypothetical protein
VRPEHRARPSAACREVAASSIWADSLVACRLGARRTCASPAASNSRATRPWSGERRARSTCSIPTARRADRAGRTGDAVRSQPDRTTRRQPVAETISEHLRAPGPRRRSSPQALAQARPCRSLPVAVGGRSPRSSTASPPTSKGESGIKLRPIYSGTYQDTITKALTAVKGGEPPVTSILLSTDMYTLIDEDAIVPFDDLIKTPEDRAWLKSFYPAFMENSQTGGKTWGIPFQRSTIVLYWNKEMFKEAGLDPNRAPANWKEQVEYAQKLTKRDAAGKVTQWGIQIPSSGFPYWLFQALAIQAGTNLMNATGTETYYDRPEVIGAAVLGRPREEGEGAPGRHRRVGHDAEGFLRAEDGDDVDDDGQPDQREEQRQVRVRGGHAAGRQAARLAHGRRQLPHLQEEHAGPAGGLARSVDHDAQRAAQWGRHRLRRVRRRGRPRR